MFNWLDKLMSWYMPSFGIAEVAMGVGIIGGLNSLFGGDDGGSAASDAAAASSNTASQISQAQWNYYLQNYQPLETGLIKQATEAGSPEEFARARGAANADVTGAFDTARKQTLNRMQSFGINPGSPAYQSTAASTDIAEGAAKAGALTMADRNTRNLAYSKGLDVVGLGRGIPAQSAASSLNAANTGLNASNLQFNQNQRNMANAGYGLNTIGTAAEKWFGTNRTQPINTMAGGTPGNYLDWGNDYGYAEGGMVIPEKYRHVAAKAFARENMRRMKRRKAQPMTPHQGSRFASGGGVGMQGMEPRDASMMGEMRGPGTETSDSIPATIDGQQPARLSDGEFVVSAEAVDLTGEEILEAINRAGLEKRGLEPRGQDDEQMDAGMPAYKHGGRVSRYACGGLARR